MSALDVVRTVAELRERVAAWHRADETVGLVPTMGALHDGHMALVAASRSDCSRTVATLFVNPKQFGPNEDFEVYPRNEDEDSAKLAAAGADLLFAPGVAEMYPAGHSTTVSVGPLGEVLEGTFRPGFFTGVATVVTKLLVQALADRGYFGEKDFQQLQVIRRLARDLDLPTEIVGVPTVRESDGLAMSSRNAYLGEAERAAAPALHGALASIAAAVRSGGSAVEAIAEGEVTLTTAGFDRVDYLAVVDAGDMRTVSTLAELEGRPGRVLGAAHLGSTRLIDNLPI
ncbi:MAG: pantoate--beta-alanine ligase [Rhodospirillales bacterium]